MEQLKTLQAKKIKTSKGTKTHLYKDGSLYATIPEEQTQPRKGTKEIILNCWTWNMEWI